jgi:GT2 family glycosyltransferase
MKNINVTVVVVTYNAISWISSCLKSVSSYEVILIDNSSTDGTLHFVEEHFSNVTIVKQEKNLGFGKANNIGIKKAYEDGADYVFLLNQDAWVEPDTIEKLVQAHQNEFTYGVISPMHLNGRGDALDYKFSIYIQPSRCKNLYSDIYLNTIKNELYEIGFVNAAAWLISRECIEKVGGFNPSFFLYGEDDNYLQRVYFHSLKVGIHPKCVIYHDRESKTDNPYFKDKLLIERNFVLKFSNPFSHSGFQSEYKKIYKNLLKSIFSVNRNGIKMNYKKIRILNSLDKRAIIKNMNESKLIKSSFLD